MRAFRSAAVTAVALTVTLASPALGAGSGTVQVNPTHPSTMRDRVHLLAGSSSWVLYRLNQTFAGGGTLQGSTITARSKAGKSRNISRHDRDWSMTGTSLAGMRRSGDADYYDLHSGHHTRISLPKTTSGQFAFLGAGPGGVFFAHAGKLKFRKPSGKTTGYGDLGFAADGFLVASSGPHGIVIADGTTARYFPYADPSTSQALDIAADGDPDVQCLSVDAHYAACTQIASVGREVELVPLDGSAATTSGKDQSRLPRMAVDGPRLYWVVYSAPGDGHLDVLAADTAASATDLASNRPIVSAYDGVVVPNPHEDALHLVTSATKSKRLLRTPHSPVTVADYSLSAGRIVDEDDQVDPDSSAPLSLRSRSRHVSATKVSIGKASIVAHPTSEAYVFSSGATIAYTAGYLAAESGGELDVHSPLGDRTITGLDLSNQPAPATLSGDRVLVNEGSDLAGEWTVVDLRTGDSQPIAPSDDHAEVSVVALWGNDVAYQKDSTVYQQNLHSGTTTTVTTFGTAGAPLSEYGHWVSVTENRRTQMVNMHSGKRTILHHISAIGLTSAGLLYGSGKGYFVHTYQGKTHKVVGPNAGLFGYPEIDGHAVASDDKHANLVLRARHLPVPRPQALGAAVTPSTFDPSTTKSWDTYIPYSLSLGSCHVTIKRHGNRIRRLACTTARRKAGVATVHWNGRSDSGKAVKAGTYHWHVHAKGGSGAALNAAGHHKPVHGTVTIS
jgi:hypothetical protein